MLSTKPTFLSFDGASLLSHCCIYHNGDSKSVGLIPVIHIGNSTYFRKLVEYAGNRPTVFEYMKFVSPDQDKTISIKNFEDFMEVNASTTENFYNTYKKRLNNFYKKNFTKDMKELWKLVKKEVKNSDNKIKQIYDLSEKTRFTVQSLTPIQLYWAEIMNLSHQFIAIDYENDILRRSNWIITDLDMGKLMGDVDTHELLKNILTEPSKEVLNEVLKEINIILSSILGTVELANLPNVSQRRERLATWLMASISQQYKIIEDVSPEYMLNMRNNMVENTILEILEENDEVMVFFGATHMIGIEKFLTENGFTFKGEEQFKVFDINDDDY
ncbi:MAG: hypothetical protein KGD73_11065 [Candidatus Lokiarchaeota archaeon]|nr:hypothetical protein [Candidatus Lokiarchaeota archaeon]